MCAPPILIAQVSTIATMDAAHGMLATPTPIVHKTQTLLGTAAFRTAAQLVPVAHVISLVKMIIQAKL
jgi:hypothetical protein